MKISQGTVLYGKEKTVWEDEEVTYQGCIGDVHFAIDNDDLDVVFFTTEELEKYFHLPKEQWVPSLYEKYWTIEAYSEDGVTKYTWDFSNFDNSCLNNGMVWKTKEEALEFIRRGRGI